MLGCNKDYTVLAFNFTLKNSKRTISVLVIKRRHRNNNIKEEYMKNIHSQMLSLANTLLNSEPYTM